MLKHQTVPRLSFPPPKAKDNPPIPGYLRNVYNWAYLDPQNVQLLDRDLVVSLILWGNHKKLQRAAFAEFKTGQRVLHASHVYGSLIPNLAELLGPFGRLEVIDVAPVQVENCRRKLRGFSWAKVRLADARDPGGGPFDAVNCYFLLHEMPDGCKRAVIDALLAKIRPGGKVVFMDYHKPKWWHPLKGIMSLVFDLLEPFAEGLWVHEISEFASNSEGFAWTKETYFGGLYQKVVVKRVL